MNLQQSSMADSGIPVSTTMTMPSITATSTLMNGGASATPPALTPESLVARLPSIIQPAPVTVGPTCGDAGIVGPIDQWVGDHPILAALALAGLAWMAWGKGKR